MNLRTFLCGWVPELLVMCLNYDLYSFEENAGLKHGMFPSLEEMPTHFVYVPLYTNIPLLYAWRRFICRILYLDRQASLVDVVLCMFPYTQIYRFCTPGVVLCRRLLVRISRSLPV